MSLEDTIWQCLEKAVSRFNSGGDSASLLCPRSEKPRTKSESAAAGERAIAHRLAFYIECELRAQCLVGDSSPIVVDCEYNRHLGAVKSLAAEAEKRIKDIVWKARRNSLEADDEGFYVFSIAPDIVVHQRRMDANNLLVVEVKKRSNPETDKYDALKLELFTKSKQDEKGYGYKFGAWVVAEDELHPGKRFLNIVAQYKDGEGNTLAA